MHKSEAFVPFIHVLRGLAPLIVLWVHLGGAWLAGSHKQVLPAFQWYRTYFSEPLHLAGDGAHMAVVVFFLISGYIISHVGQFETPFQFVVKRVFRILPTLTIAVIAAWLVHVVSPLFDLPAFYGTVASSTEDYISTALLYVFAVGGKPAVGAAWSLYVEVIFYALFALWLAAVKARPNVSTAGLTASVAVVSAIVLAVPALRPQMLFLAYLPMFLIGRSLYTLHTKVSSIRLTIVFVAVNLIVMCAAWEAFWPGYLTKETPFEPIVTYLAAPGLFMIAMYANIRRVPRILMFFGNISYALYILHEPIGNFSISILYKYGLNATAAVVGGTVISIGAAAFVTKLVERPAQKAARYILSFRRPEEPQPAS